MKRRQFLQNGITALAASTLGSHAYASSVDRVPRVVLIGSGWYGKTDLYALCQVAPVDVIALCDPDSKMLDEAAERAAGWHQSKKTPRKYRDYRQMLSDHEFDIVLVGTPDHWHSLPLIDAVQRGADVYCQKPVSVDVKEGQAMVATARRYDRVVQVGTQLRPAPHLKQAIDEVIREDKLGKIGHVEICCFYHMRDNRIVENTPPPPTLDYELWTGPAPMRPYNPLVHPKQWRLFWEYSNGIIGDMGVHMLDMVRWMLDLGWPSRVFSSGGIYVDKNSSATISDTQNATFEYPEFNVVWTHRTWGGKGPNPAYQWAAFIYGEKGTLKAGVGSWELVSLGDGKKIRQEQRQEFDKYPQDLTEQGLDANGAAINRLHQQDFLKAIAEKTRPVADIQEGHISTASCILANLSMQLGRRLSWDPELQEVIGDPEATKLLARPYREPWIHPQPVNS